MTVVENPVLSLVTFSGNSDIKLDKLQPVIKLKPGAVYTQAKGHADALAVRDLYRHEGRMTTQVEAKPVLKPGNKIELTFVISEGKVNKVSAITFEGNAAFSASDLESVIKTARSSWLDILKSDSIYVAERLEEDRDLLRRHYLTHGFAEVKVVTAEGALDATGNGYAVKFVIDEGTRFSFGAVSLDPAVKDLDSARLTPLILPQAGEIYNAALIDQTVEAISLALWESGQKFARVVPELRRDHETHRVTVAFRVEEGPHITVERVAISGNTKTQASVILREMKLREGDAFNALMLTRDRTRIKALGFFKSVDTKVKPGANAESVIIAVDVVEDETLVASVGGGYSTVEGIIGDIALEEKNLFGTGQSAKIKLGGSLKKLQAEAGFTEPHLLGSNVAGGFDLFYRDYDASTLSSYKSQKIGGDLRLGYPITDTLTGSVNYTFAQNKIYDVGANASPAIKEAVSGFPNANSDTYYTSSVGYALAYDTRNSKKLPTSGNFFQLTQDFAGAGGDVRYIKSTVDARTYLPVSNNVTLVGRATAGNIAGWGGQDVRLLDMYYMGGETVRGFAAAGIGPRDTASANLDALGGKSYIATTAEARFGLPFIPDEIGLRGAVFADAGSLFGTSASAAKLPGIAGANATLRASTGVGLIWDSPLGPLRTDYAFPLSKQPFDKTQAWSFGLAAF
jgi:outer membrane protein insertion porin family